MQERLSRLERFLPVAAKHALLWGDRPSSVASSAEQQSAFRHSILLLYNNRCQVLHDFGIPESGICASHIAKSS